MHLLHKSSSLQIHTQSAATIPGYNPKRTNDDPNLGLTMRACFAFLIDFQQPENHREGLKRSENRCFDCVKHLDYCWNLQLPVLLIRLPHSCYTCSHSCVLSAHRTKQRID